MARRRVNTTKYDIIQVATKLFIEKGYSATAPKMICDELDISTGNLTYYFPTKEHLLVTLVEMLCNFQGGLIEETVEEGNTTVLAVCLELATMAAASEENPSAKDLFISFYTSPMCLDIIRKNDARRARNLFQQYCPDWDEQRFFEAEILVSGIEYATLMTTDLTVPLEVRIAGALHNILTIYCVPESVRKQKIEKVLTMDYRALSRDILEEFKQFILQTNEQTFEMLLNGA